MGPGPKPRLPVSQGRPPSPARGSAKGGLLSGVTAGHRPHSAWSGGPAGPMSHFPALAFPGQRSRSQDSSGCRAAQLRAQGEGLAGRGVSSLRGWSAQSGGQRGTVGCRQTRLFVGGGWGSKRRGQGKVGDGESRARDRRREAVVRTAGALAGPTACRAPAGGVGGAVRKSWVRVRREGACSAPPRPDAQFSSTAVCVRCCQRCADHTSGTEDKAWTTGLRLAPGTGPVAARAPWGVEGAGASGHPHQAQSLAVPPQAV